MIHTLTTSAERPPTPVRIARISYFCPYGVAAASCASCKRCWAGRCFASPVLDSGRDRRCGLAACHAVRNCPQVRRQSMVDIDPRIRFSPAAASDRAVSAGDSSRRGASCRSRSRLGQAGRPQATGLRPGQVLGAAGLGPTPRARLQARHHPHPALRVPSRGRTGRPSARPVRTGRRGLLRR